MTKSNGYCDKISVYSAARCGCKPSSMPRRTGSFAAYFPDRQVRTKYNLADREEKYPAPQDNQYQDDL